MSSEDIINTNETLMKCIGIDLPDDDKRLPSPHWLPELSKSSVKHRFIPGSSKRIAKQMSSFLTNILGVIKTRLL